MFPVVLLMAMSMNVFAANINVIKEPKPTLVESRYVELNQTGSVDEDLGDKGFLFYPKSFTSDSAGNVYVYDSLQAKVFKFDKNLNVITSFGDKGAGPGEFSGVSKTRPVWLNIGPDGNLYANDVLARKVMVFNLKGKFIHDLVYGYDRVVKKPVLDGKGNLYLYSLGEDQSMNFKNLENKPILRVGFIEDSFAYLYRVPNLEQGTRRHKYILYATVLEMMQMDITPGGNILVYYPTDSTLLILKNGKILRRIKLWPRNALAWHKTALLRFMKLDKTASKNMFFNLFADSDDANLFYLQLGRDERKQKNFLYQFDLNGQVRKVFYVTYKQGDPYTLFRSKVNGGFLAIREEKIVQLKEQSGKKS